MVISEVFLRFRVKSMKKTQNKTVKVKKALPLENIDVAAVEALLPAKTPRSHHVIIKVADVAKSFVVGNARVDVLKSIKLNLYSGEFAIVSGPSGSGKSTLLNAILGLEPPSQGRVEVRGVNLYQDLSENERTQFRREKIGVVFQQSNWIKSLDVVDNVSYPLWLTGASQQLATSRALESLEKVGMAQWARHKPSELSGGQQQRVALARALITDPGIIVADEPTGNLDTQASVDMMVLLTKLNRIDSRMILMVTHNLSLLPLATRRVVMKDGNIIHDEHD